MLKKLLSQVKEYKTAAILTPTFMLLEVIMEMVIPLLMASIIDDGVNAGNMTHIFKVGGLMVVAAGLGLFGGIMGGKYGAISSAGFAKNLREAMFRRIQTYSFANIDKFSSSSLITRLTTDVTNVQNAFQMILRMGMRAPASLIVALTMSIIISPRLSLVYVGAVVFLVIVIAILLPKTHKIFTEVFEKYDAMNESVQENISAIRVVKAYVREEHEIKKFHKASENIYRMFIRAEKVMVTAMPLMTVTVYACILLISWFGAHMIVDSSLTTGQLMSLLTYCMNILMSLMMLAMMMIMITMSTASATRIVEVIDEESTIIQPENPVMEVPDGHITFEHVNFTYNQGSNDYVLSDINLDIAAGETIGIIGGTGSSKTSLVNLISRLYDVSEG